MTSVLLRRKTFHSFIVDDFDFVLSDGEVNQNKEVRKHTTDPDFNGKNTTIKLSIVRKKK